jgi:hypothetical protein
MLIVAGPQEKRHIPTPQARPATTVGKTPNQNVIDSCVLQLVNDIKALAALEVTHFRQRGGIRPTSRRGGSARVARAASGRNVCGDLRVPTVKTRHETPDTSGTTAPAFEVQT